MDLKKLNQANLFVCLSFSCCTLLLEFCDAFDVLKASKCGIRKRGHILISNIYHLISSSIKLLIINLFENSTKKGYTYNRIHVLLSQNRFLQKYLRRYMISNIALQLIPRSKTVRLVSIQESALVQRYATSMVRFIKSTLYRIDTQKIFALQI